MPAKRQAAETARILSIDVVRGLTILVMLFVNDVAGVNGAPAWMKHVFPSTADGMTLVDVVFPAFLFIVGLSLPFALERRFGRGESLLAVAGHILVRTFGLLVIGVMMVNTENISAKGPFDPRLWQLLMYGGVCLVWTAPPSAGRRGVWIRRAAGAILLMALALVYRGEPGSIGFRPQWWGILGLIGWAYLVTGFLFIFLRRNALGFAAAVALLYCVYAADAAGFFGFLGVFNQWISVGSMLGSHAAITVSGALLGLMLLPSTRTQVSRIRSALLLAGVLAAAAVLLHSLNGIHRIFIYNKNAATPPWCLLSSAWTALAFACLYWLLDARGFSGGKIRSFAPARLLASAGQNALFAFILGPIAYTLFSFLPGLFGGADPYWGWLGGSFAVGFIRSLGFAVAGICVTAWLQRRGHSLRV
jgi:hypothetical protein